MKLPICVLLWLLLLTTPSEANRDGMQGQEEDALIRPIRSMATRESRARQKSKASIGQRKLLRDADCSSGTSLRMHDYSLSQQARFLSGDNADMRSSFETLVRMEEEIQQQQQQLMIQAPLSISPFANNIFTSSFLFTFLAFWRDPWSAHTLWKSAISSKVKSILAIAWIPWCWYHPSRFALVDLLVLIQFARQPYVTSFLQTEILPLLGKTIKSIVLAELWSRAWHWIYGQIDQVQQEMLLQNDSRNGSNTSKQKQHPPDGHLVWPTSEPPAWLSSLHATLVGGVRRSMKVAFKKSIQETVSSAFMVWRTALEEKLWTATDEDRVLENQHATQTLAPQIDQHVRGGAKQLVMATVLLY